jgi:hypothetical protein
MVFPENIAIQDDVSKEIAKNERGLPRKSDT